MMTPIRDFEELRACIATTIGKPVTDELVYGFVAGEIATELKLCSHSELMKYVIKGLAPMSKERVQEWIDNGVEFYADDGYEAIADSVRRCFANSIYTA